MSTMHVAAEWKARFESQRAAVRAELGWPVTQPGMFALLVALADARGEELVRLAREGVGR